MTCSPRPPRIPAVWMRGGTSKGLFVLAQDLPSDNAARDRLLLRMMGSPDPSGRQLDGIGGGSSSTSKVAILSRSTRPGFDVDYLFGQVATDCALIDYSGNCGNLTAAVALFAAERGWTAPHQAAAGALRSTRIWQANTAQRIEVDVPWGLNGPAEVGSFAEPGVSFAGPELHLRFFRPAGAGCGRGLLPTGQVKELLDDGGRRVSATLVDAGNPMVFVRAHDFGCRGTETPQQLAASPGLLARLAWIRAQAAARMGLVEHPEEADHTCPATPKVALVGPAADYRTSSGVEIRADQYDVCARVLSMGQPHGAFTGTGAIALVAAATLPDSLVGELWSGSSLTGTFRLRLGHPAGTMELTAEVAATADQGGELNCAGFSRTARVLMDGWLVPPVGAHGF